MRIQRLARAVAAAAAGLFLLAACGSSAKPSTDPSVLIGAGVAAQRQGHVQDAIALFGEALKKNPHSAVAYFDRGVIEQRIGRSGAALTDYNAAIAIAPNYVAALYNEATMYAGVDPARAIVLYQQVTRLQPTNAAGWLNLGLLQVQLHQRAAATTSLATALHNDASFLARVPAKYRHAVKKAARSVQ
jgi:tetratricopeptide (TPR) repeat protein